MITSNAAVQNSKTKAQQGFSLIELLVVVAIIGVLAAAGIVGYTSYLEGVKSDTHKNNVISLKKGLDVIAVARGGGLTVNPSECGGAIASGLDFTVPSNLALAVTCVQAVANEGKFKSPIDTGKSSGTLYVLKNDTVAGCNDPVTPTPSPLYNEKGAILVSGVAGTSGSITLTACDKDATATAVHSETIALK